MNKNFERVIQQYLQGRAKEDGRLAERMQLKTKSIGECCKYIIGEVRKLARGGEVAMSDEEVYGLAVHYYDEDNVKVKSVNARVVSPMDMREDKPEGRKSKVEAVEEREKPEGRKSKVEAVEEREKPEGRKSKVAARMDERQLSLFD